MQLGFRELVELQPAWPLLMDINIQPNGTRMNPTVQHKPAGITIALGSVIMLPRTASPLVNSTAGSHTPRQIHMRSVTRTF